VRSVGRFCEKSLYLYIYNMHIHIMVHIICIIYVHILCKYICIYMKHIVHYRVGRFCDSEYLYFFLKRSLFNAYASPLKKIVHHDAICF